MNKIFGFYLIFLCFFKFCYAQQEGRALLMKFGWPKSRTASTPKFEIPDILIPATKTKSGLQQLPMHLPSIGGKVKMLNVRLKYRKIDGQAGFTNWADLQCPISNDWNVQQLKIALVAEIKKSYSKSLTKLRPPFLPISEWSWEQVRIVTVPSSELERDIQRQTSEDGTATTVKYPYFDNTEKPEWLENVYQKQGKMIWIDIIDIESVVAVLKDMFEPIFNSDVLKEDLTQFLNSLLLTTEQLRSDDQISEKFTEWHRTFDDTIKKLCDRNNEFLWLFNRLYTSAIMRTKDDETKFFEKDYYQMIYGFLTTQTGYLGGKDFQTRIKDVCAWNVELFDHIDNDEISDLI